MGKYCCFFDPQRDYSEKSLQDCCPICGRTYGYVLEDGNLPGEISDGAQNYKILRPISRGFYGATYLCEVNTKFGRKHQVLLKVIPQKLYDFFHKDFYQECQKHADVAENTEHLVKIEDAFEASICFGKENVQCYVAVLQYIPGEVLSDYIENENNNQTRAYAQIVIDLLKLWNELYLKGEYHNDLHLGNLIVQQLDDSVQRVDAIHEKIRLVAIDLNSVSDESLSDSEGKRRGDRKNIANHIALLSGKIRSKYKSIDDISDTDYRLIQTLNKISSILGTKSGFVDSPEVSELIEMVKEELKSNISYSPWKKTFQLAKLNDGINAQTLPSCYVPNLLVDPENNWIKEISITDPQLITGMRGCGKTMLLAAMDVHARLMQSKEGFINDRFVGVMSSCRDLIDVLPVETKGITKLILLYSIQIIRLIRHIRDVFPESVISDPFHVVSESLIKIFGVRFDRSVVISEAKMERTLIDWANGIDAFAEEYSLTVSCINAFETLAEAAVATSDVLSNKKVYFLLDDASTRYLPVESILALLTKISFQSGKCVFKVTTEMQTLYSFNSPGNIEMAHETRDYQIFDLGADVYNHTRDPKKGIAFLESIIVKRLSACNRSGITSLEKTLGNCTLSEIARRIITTDAAQRKDVYYGATALSALCVGDIGDIILLFDTMLAKNENGGFPISATVQTQCYQILCSRRMYNLDRKEGKLREYVRAFSEASYKSLINSRKYMDTTKRIRQYNSLYIRMTTGNIEHQQENLRKLIDSGIFVFADGNGWPRTKSGDCDPMTQIKLSYRKLFGLSFFIGLGSSDRYELSGSALEEWLEHPTKEALLKNAGDANDETEYVPDNKLEESKTALSEIVGENQQLSIFEVFGEEHSDDDRIKIKAQMIDGIINRAKIRQDVKDITGASFDCGIFGLGFEERCYESIKRLVSTGNTFSTIYLIKYKELGYSNDILSLLVNQNVVTIDFNDTERMLELLVEHKSALIDVSGLYKPIIFKVVRTALIAKMKLTVVHTSAQYYYPLNDEINSRIKKLNDEGESMANQFADLMSSLDTGDAGDYSNEPLLNNCNYDPVRPTALVGCISPKYSRMFSVLDKIEYDSIHLFVSEGDSDRDLLSRTAGEIAMNNYPSVKLRMIKTSDIEQNFYELANSYIDLFDEKNFNFEIALTGSKMQAVVAAVFSSVCKVSQCWYVKPGVFDTQHFTKGVGVTQSYSIEIRD